MIRKHHLLSAFAVLLLFIYICKSAIAQNYVGTVSPTYIIGEKNGKIQTLAPAPSIQDLIRAMRLASGGGYPPVLHVDWNITDAVVSTDGKSIIFLAFPTYISKTRRLPGLFYAMVFNIANKKVIGLPITDLWGRNAKMVLSPKSNKIFVYVNGHLTYRDHEVDLYKAYVIDRKTFDYAEIKMTTATEGAIISSATFASDGSILCRLQEQPRNPPEATSKATRTVKLLMRNVPSKAQIVRAIAATDKKLARAADRLGITSIRVQENWVRCYTRGFRSSHELVLLKNEGQWRTIPVPDGVATPSMHLPNHLFGD